MEFISRGCLEEICCNVCGSKNYRILYKANLSTVDFGENPSSFGISSDSTRHPQVVSCNDCGLMYANPRETAQDLLNNYRKVEDERYLFEEKNRRETFLRDFRFIEKYCLEKGKLLDIGCFVGLFMDTTREEGWEVFGVEPSIWATRYGRDKLKLNITNGTLDNAIFPKSNFDLILMWDVLEHMTDPKEGIMKAAELLKDKGIIAINTPNFDCIFSKLLRERFWFIERTHLYYFTADAIRKLLNNAGLELVTIRRHWRSLNIAYLISRAEERNRLFSGVLKLLSRSVILSHMRIFFYFGQMTLIARKIGNCYENYPCAPS